MDNDAPQSLGPRLKALRRTRGWTLEAASERTGLAKSTLSKIENGRMSPTVEVLLKLSQGFGVDLAGLFGEARPDPAARSLTRAGTGPRHETRSYSHELLGADLADKRITPVRARVKARTLLDYGPLDQHEGQQFLLVLTGAVTMHFAGEAPLRLAAGDSLYFDTRTPHAVLSDGPEEAEILWVHAG
ncbi:helix-turn-helix domain-containing protein [Inquilinus sp. NPDC058860]|uniref:helix-turn-helix domain-containing protein n=1 Tax=Inquilinus sp. NPDC058860 TaxID=3346652 RepID=UPI00368D3B38